MMETKHTVWDCLVGRLGLPGKGSLCALLLLATATMWLAPTGLLASRSETEAESRSKSSAPAEEETDQLKLSLTHSSLARIHRRRLCQRHIPLAQVEHPKSAQRMSARPGALPAERERLNGIGGPLLC
jgi:hypothetical protein